MHYCLYRVIKFVMILKI